MTTHTIDTTNSAGCSPCTPEAHQRSGFRRFKIDGKTFHAKDKVDGVLINPKLPEDFDTTPNSIRPPSHEKWWGRPYIVTFPSRTLYEVRCLDGGAWDRSTSWGVFATLGEAIACATLM